MPRRGAFVDSRGVRWDPNGADYEGWLWKKSRWVGSWRQRFFALKGSKLFFAKSENESPHGMIDLVDCINVKSAESQAKRKYAMLITLVDEQFFLCGENEVQKDEWIAQIGKAIIHHSSMFCGTLGDFGFSKNNNDGFEPEDRERSTTSSSQLSNYVNYKNP